MRYIYIYIRDIMCESSICKVESNQIESEILTPNRIESFWSKTNRIFTYWHQLKKLKAKKFIFNVQKFKN